MPIRDLHQDRAPRVAAMRLGHIRLGVFAKGRPQASDSLIFTSADPDRLKPLHADFGGTIERYEPQGAGEEPWRLISDSDAFTALFPFGDLEANVRQDYELWGRGGLKRLCDGFQAWSFETDEMSGETTETASPCVCEAQEERECQTTTRVHLLLPQTGLGIWELVTHSKIAAIHLWDQGRFIAELAPGRMNHLPVRVVYAPRQIRYFDQKEGKRRSTTKRVVSLSIAGDAPRALAALNRPHDEALVASVRAALSDAGRTQELPEGNNGTQAQITADASDDDETEATEAPAAPSKGKGAAREKSPEGAAGSARSRGVPDAAEASSGGPTDLWPQVKAAYGSGADAYREAQARWPDVKSVTDLSDDQLRELLERPSRGR